MFRSLALVALLGMAVAGCSDDPEPPAAAPPAVVVSTPPPPSVIVDGKSYPQAFADCAQMLWDGRVAVWNKLVQARDAAGRDQVVVDGKSYDDQPAYFKAKAWPATFEATLTAAATKAACP